MATRSSTSDVITLANAATTTGGKATKFWQDQFGHIQSFSQWTLQVSGTGTGLGIKLNGSLDGVNWFDSGTASVAANGIYKFTFPSAVPYVQANITAITGGSVTILGVGAL